MKKKLDCGPEGYGELIEFVSCDICGCDETQTIYPSRFSALDFKKNRERSFEYASSDLARGAIVRCVNCDLVYMNPRDKNVSALYEAAEDLFYFSSAEDRQASFEQDIKELHRVLRIESGEGKKILDVGCSYGFFMDVAKRNRWEVYGCELSKKHAAFAKKNLNNVCSKDIDSCGFPEEFFDVVVLYDVLEHVPSPKIFLQKIASHTKPDGTIVVVTPNFSSISARVMGGFWPNITRMHLYYFTPHTIRKLFMKSGFTSVKCARHKRIASFGAIIKWLRKFPALYSVMNILLGNKILRGFKITLSIGDSVFFARKTKEN